MISSSISSIGSRRQHERRKIQLVPSSDPESYDPSLCHVSQTDVLDKLEIGATSPLLKALLQLSRSLNLADMNVLRSTDTL